jgi:flavin reductase (DIM6/NTAB) family NADH-FMN oxidoreductase RutF
MNQAEQGASLEVDPRLFRRVMGSFTTGVTVITAREGPGYRGMTANAFMSGSLEPPLCVVSVAERAHMHALLLASDAFGVSILAEDQEDCSIHFAGRPVSGFTPEMDESGRVPLLRGACAKILATIAARHTCGDHTLFIGRIVHLEASDRKPLIYHSGRYVSLVMRATDHRIPVPEFW